MAIRINNKKEQIKLIKVDAEKCVNCHACISVCPVKYCNDAKGDIVTINNDLCISCGACIERCTHDARIAIDDISTFEMLLIKNEKMVVLAAPSIVSNFKDNYLKINGWFKSKGIDVFDVSYGAELCTKSYANYIKENPNIETVISSACPSIVNYIELYNPELLKYLAPIDTPIGHMIKYIRSNHPEYSNHRIVVLTPCLAKKSEFSSTFIDEDILNVGFSSLDNFFNMYSIDISSYEEVQYKSNRSERAVLYPNPGGLLSTLERHIPGISNSTRKIEGTKAIYEYISSLEENISSKKAKPIIDCLNCEKGCNAGCLSLNENVSLEELEYDINKRALISKVTNINIDEEINKEWNKISFTRNKYIDKSINNKLVSPSKEELKIINKSLYKSSKKDVLDCNSCGYETCYDMAIAIHNGLNKPENCHLFLAKQKEIIFENALSNNNDIIKIIEEINTPACILSNTGIILFANNAANVLFSQNLNEIHVKDVFAKYISLDKQIFSIKFKESIIKSKIVKVTDKYVIYFNI